MNRQEVESIFEKSNPLGVIDAEGVSSTVEDGQWLVCQEDASSNFFVVIWKETEKMGTCAVNHWSPERIREFIY